MKFNELYVGLKFEYFREISTLDVKDFATVSGDFNPVHLDEVFAATTPFKSKIVHGMLVGSIISMLIATELPGPGSVYLNQTLDFLHPIYHNSIVKIIIEVEKLKEDKKIVFLYTNCWVGDIQVINGKAVVKCLD